MAADHAQLDAALSAVVEPELGAPLGDLGLLRAVRPRRRRVHVEVALPVAAWPGADQLAEEIHRAALAVDGVEEVDLEYVVMDEAERAALRARLRARMLGAGAEDGGGEEPAATGHGHDHGHAHAHGQAEPLPAFLAGDAATRVIGVSSGKGGVGKSTVTVNLAVALARAGHSVGLLDADVYGFSVPKMLGTDHDPVIIGDIVVPTAAHGVRCLSMGYFVPDDQPVIWRGPMLHKAIQQFLTDAYWGEPDFLLVDMPPGTGDVALTLADVMPRAEIVVVTTPQPAAQRVAQRSAFAARRLKLSVRGVIENMSWFTGDDGTRYELFGSGGGALLASDLGVPLLGQVPLVNAVRLGGDEGRPVTAVDPESETARAFETIAGKLADLGPARVYRRELTLR
ncbi:MAG TPA: Mrp/NBP35 family ATP-binding protein [Acidimicrobiales bacterium]|nr:Mrp/NBP35 family ATP-binding protein [Acidimicrobiales bacterium]